MRKIICLLFVSLIFGYTAKAQTEVPAPVKTAFTKLFANASEAEWEAQDKYFEASFYNDDEYLTAVRIDKTGKWIQTSTEIADTDIPKAVSDAVSKELPEGEINFAAKVKTADGKNFFDIVVYTESDAFSMQIDATGKVLKKEKK